MCDFCIMADRDVEWRSCPNARKRAERRARKNAEPPTRLTSDTPRPSLTLITHGEQYLDTDVRWPSQGAAIRHSEDTEGET